MAGRDCLPTTPSDSRTHAQRAHAYTESSKTPHSCVSDMRPAAHCNIPYRAPDMRTKHAYAQPMRPGCCERLRPCARPHSRAHCLCQTPDLRYLPQSTNKAPACDTSGGARPALQGRLRHPSARPPSAGSDAPDHLVPLGAPLCSLGPNLRKTGRTRSSGVEGDFEGSSIRLSSHQHRTA